MVGSGFGHESCIREANRLAISWAVLSGCGEMNSVDKKQVLVVVVVVVVLSTCGGCS